MLRVEDGKLRHILLNPKFSTVELVREDEKYYYVEVPDAAAVKAKRRVEKAPEGLLPLVDVPASEYEVVTPKASRIRLRSDSGTNTALLSVPMRQA